ncbi:MULTISPECIES: NAD(P)H-dependent oxidoreductase [unclassified Rhizobium]|uniref:NAD(P)H-dependent oxidoreductase n=1 Tax=unclassified Rhizobium TaxID=2613769 RepID=UPI000DE0EE9F|nr:MULTISPECIES: NAD(P)H-dependent oxidoreductase [unclassified Rhizobium]MBB3286948.1 putative NADPH-quinone reductase [Rhizobium sp. BK252]MBB3401688.1 putative NADPH-quinone reductase [Rhizobium sp. BK289]MBB3414368.1 putative NADPH-quinone reductase [Rhizobium sp. BK284]MBB3482256.1 putative NADPH-quinone reductase [Rhizobium sp. BK347]MDK4718444.1 NAD(P)H-dependent oxidoreductase [Rhizobium sp. CNPSo 3968]
MKVLVLHSHPVEESYGAALHRQTVESLKGAGHEVDDCNLYAEGFDPVLSRQDRVIYHDYPGNIEAVKSYVERLQRAEALVIVTPVWNFGFPAILKGYFDRVWLPGVSFELVDGKVRSKLQHIRKLGAVLTYGADPFRAFIAGNPPKKIVKRVLRAQIKPFAPVVFLAHYDMNRSTDETRGLFLDKVKREMARF